MIEVKFETTIKNGFIEVPEIYKQELKDGSEVKVIIVGKKHGHRQQSIMDELTKNPISVKGLRKLTRDEMHERKL